MTTYINILIVMSKLYFMSEFLIPYLCVPELKYREFSILNLNVIRGGTEEVLDKTKNPR